MVTAKANDLRERILSYVWLGSYILTAFFILEWIYRSTFNVLQFAAKGLSVDPGWAVASYFVPVMSFFVPFAVMKKMWKASVDPQAWQAQRSSYLIYLWWALFLIANFLAYYRLIASFQAKTIDGLLGATLIAAIFIFLFIPLDLVFVRLLSKIPETQVEQSQKA